MKVSIKATHRGTCQICGATQMLPAGVLAKHGYTTKWGFFSGVCTGSGRLPFEQSTDAIADAIAAVKLQIADTNREVQTYHDLNHEVNNGRDVWVHVYQRGDGYRSDGGYKWMSAYLHDFTTDRETYAPGAISKCMFTTHESFMQRGPLREVKPLTEKIEAYSEQWNMHTIQEWARFLNLKYADTLLKKNAQRKDWVKWQNARVASWVAAPLLPR